MNEINSESYLAKVFTSVIRPTAKLIVVHSNLGVLGDIAKDPEMIIRALERALPEGCTLAVPTFTFSFCKTGYYDSEHSSSEVGLLGETFRRMPGVMRTEHPIYSFAVKGPLAEQMVRFNDKYTCWGNKSSFELFERVDADLMMLGCGWEYCTLFHRAEELAEVPYRYKKLFLGKAIYKGSEQQVEVAMLVRRLDIRVKNIFNPFIEKLRSLGFIRSAVVGRGMVEVAGGKDIMKVGSSMLEQDKLAVLDRAKDFERLEKQCHIALLSSANLDIFVDYFRSEADKYIKNGCHTYVPPFNQYRQQIVSSESELYLFNPQFIIFMERSEELLGTLLKDILKVHNESSSLLSLIEDKIAAYIEIIRIARERTKARLLVFNFDMPARSPLFLADSVTNGGQREIIETANKLLLQGLEDLEDIHIIDYQRIHAGFGRSISIDEKYWFIGKIPFSKNYSIYLSRHLVGTILSLLGKTARLIILDLDNTLWGGIIGEDGLEGIQLGGDFPGNAYEDFQKTLVALKRRGIALAICSKNTEKTALNALEKHPNMVLHMSDFITHRINWNAKDINIVEIAQELSLGLESICFIDDNPAERQLVRQNLPDLIVPELPTDPARYSSFLLDLPYFETLSITKEDMGRVTQYTIRRDIEGVRKQTSSIEEFYKSLDMILFFDEYKPSNQARTLQLISKTNQFNTTTKRYTESDLKNMQETGFWIKTIALKDRFGEKEIIGILILNWPNTKKEKVFIDSMILSCRVLGRSIETGIIGWLAEQARKKSYRFIEGLIISTERNQPVRDVFYKHGFQDMGNGRFELDINVSDLKVPEWFKIEEAN